jgi:hypothetical protein
VTSLEQAGGVTTNESEARVLLEKGRAHAEAGRSAESRTVVAELVARFEHDADPAVRRLVCRALFGQAKHKLAEGVDRRAVIVDYRHILHIAERQPPIEDAAAAAVYHIGLTHGKIAIERSNQEHREKAVERFLEAEERFGSSLDSETAYWVMRAVTSHALTLPLDAAAPLYERVVARYASQPDAELRAHAVRALEHWAERRAEAGQDDLAASLRARAAAISLSARPT